MGKFKAALLIGVDAETRAVFNSEGDVDGVRERFPQGHRAFIDVADGLLLFFGQFHSSVC